MKPAHVKVASIWVMLAFFLTFSFQDFLLAQGGSELDKAKRYYDRGNYDAAITELDDILNKYSAQDPEKRPLLCEAHLILVRIFFEFEENEKVDLHVKAIFQMDPGFSFAKENSKLAAFAENLRPKPVRKAEPAKPTLPPKFKIHLAVTDKKAQLSELTIAQNDLTKRIVENGNPQDISLEFEKGTYNILLIHQNRMIEKILEVDRDMELEWLVDFSRDGLKLDSALFAQKEGQKRDVRKKKRFPVLIVVGVAMLAGLGAYLLLSKSAKSKYLDLVTHDTDVTVAKNALRQELCSKEYADDLKNLDKIEFSIELEIDDKDLLKNLKLELRYGEGTAAQVYPLCEYGGLMTGYVATVRSGGTIPALPENAKGKWSLLVTSRSAESIALTLTACRLTFFYSEETSE